MTDNEKAATFIGWTDGEFTCIYHEPCPSDCRERKRKPLGAPDMSKPENYMRALNALPVELTWMIYRDAEGDHETRIDRFKPTVIIGRTPLEALAALYDTQARTPDNV